MTGNWNFDRRVTKHKRLICQYSHTVGAFSIDPGNSIPTHITIKVRQINIPTPVTNKQIKWQQWLYNSLMSDLLVYL